MKNGTRRRVVLLALLGAGLGLALQGLEVPYLAGRVNDRAGLLDAATAGRLEERLAAFERETGAQVAVLTITSLEGEVLEDYTLRVAETWALGRAGVDDGILLLIARDDRKMRIEVGYGLEGRLTDLQAGRILDQVMAPRFRTGDYSGGIEDGVGAIVDIVRGVEVEALAGAGEGAAADMPWKPRLIGLAIFIVNVGTFSLIALFSSGCGSWFLYVFLMPFYFVFPQALIGRQAGLVLFGLWVVGFPVLKWILRLTGVGKRFLEAHPGLGKAFNNSGSWNWSSGGGGRSSGGGFSSGGFSGGGGSFGGGGSSGGW